MSGWLRTGSKANEDRQRGDSFPTRGLFAAAVNAHFRELDDGRMVFRLPALFNRRGYVIASTEQMLLLKESVLQYRRIVMASCVVLGLVFSAFFITVFLEIQFWQQLAILVGIGALEWIGSRAYFYPFTKKMEPINVRISWLWSWRSMGQTLRTSQLAFFTAFILAMFSVSLYLFVKRSEPIFLFTGAVIATSVIGMFLAWRSWWAARHE